MSPKNINGKLQPCGMPPSVDLLSAKRPLLQGPSRTTWCAVVLTSIGGFNLFQGGRSIGELHQPFDGRPRSFGTFTSIGTTLRPAFHWKRPVFDKLAQKKNVFSYKFQQKFDFSIKNFSREQTKRTIGAHRDSPTETWKSSLYDERNTWWLDFRP